MKETINNRLKEGDAEAQGTPKTILDLGRSSGFLHGGDVRIGEKRRGEYPVDFKGREKRREEKAENKGRIGIREPKIKRGCGGASEG